MSNPLKPHFIMTSSYQCSAFTPFSDEIDLHAGSRLYQAHLENFDHEIFCLEIEADSFSDAAAKIDEMFYDVYNISLFELQC